ncbi:replication factor C large subunit [uncultured Methanomethylovorans sp.]|uniref:replication factor C large subunit n=1 Tax=uncultured Methanomethylovorans sp. TaxID=183759 RepID=UPI002AA80D22|nr:replication factor C large subunit [uncultured Methanomethylovorans sp.]
MTTAKEWAEKYRPKNLADVVGNPAATGQLKLWAQQWLDGTPEQKAVLLHGPAGVGKTSTAYALAIDVGWEAIELNASDQRTADVIERIAGSASRMSTLDGISSKRLIVLDEADNMHGTSDRGGAKAIGDIIKTTGQPIVLIANDAYGIPSSVRSNVLEIKFNALQTRSIIPALKQIAFKEGLMCGVGIIEKIAENADGDMRSAINDLQAVAMGRNEINISDIATAERDNKESVFKVMERIFKGTDVKAALEATYGLDESPEDLVHWIDENLPIQYAGKEEGFITDQIQKGYEYISRADLFLGRVQKRQNYLMWRYASVLMTCGTVVSKSQPKRGFVKFSPPSLWRRMGQLKARRNMRNNVAAKIADHCHESMRYSGTEIACIYNILLEDQDYAPSVVAELELDLDELIFMTGASKVTKKIQKIYDDAQKLRKEKGKTEVIFFRVPEKQNPVMDKKQTNLADIITAEEKDPKEKESNTTMVQNNKTTTRVQSKPQKTLFDF